jgi:hypothetical protein
VVVTARFAAGVAEENQLMAGLAAENQLVAADVPAEGIVAGAVVTGEAGSARAGSQVSQSIRASRAGRMG